jgi:membrane protease YdiL (CAAX protease family)
MENMIMKKLIPSVLLVLGGAAVFVLGSPYYSVFPTNGNQIYCISITGFFLIISVILKRNPSLSIYSPAAYALFISSVATLFLSTGLLNLHNSTMPPLKNLALDKFSQFLHVVPVILVFTLLGKADLKSIFISTGKLKRGLTFGLVSFVSFAVIGIVIGFQSKDYFSSLGTAVPLLLLFVFSNAFMEELWFRGIFLKHYETIIGRNAAIIVTALIFGASHINATYEFPGGGFVFGLIVFGLGFVGAYAMIKDDSLIGPVLFHAGYDLVIIVPVINSL